MQIRNVWKDVPEPLELHEDERGRIADIFYKDKFLQVVFFTSKKGIIRGNHYRLHGTQHFLITKGSVEYWYKPSDTNTKEKMVLAKRWDIITNPPLEAHALKALEDTEFIMFSEWVRTKEERGKNNVHMQVIS